VSSPPPKPPSDQEWRPSDDEATLLARYETLGVDDNTLRRTQGALEDLVAHRFGGEESVSDEPTRFEADLSHLSVAMDITGELGRGGMAAVHAATQRTLRRRVAVKALRAEHRTPEKARQLLSEARILAALEHPAIVPVYLLATDAEGNPVIVMRAVEGKLWRHYVDEKGQLQKPASVRVEPLRWHVGVLATVCDAVEHAHGLGVLHRDLKLRNVVITESGDPYLLDWGLAAALVPNSELDLPWVADEKQLRGTPGYLAPEMAAVDGAAFGPWTDVYLLGGCLHAILTGWPRHRGRTVIEKLASAYASRPAQYSVGTPAELALIANRATAREPRARYATAGALRDALRGWLDGESVAETLAHERQALRGRQETVRIEQESVRIEQESVRIEQNALRAHTDALVREREVVRRERAALERGASFPPSPAPGARRQLLAVLTLAVLLLGTVVVAQLGPVMINGRSLWLLLLGEFLGGLLTVFVSRR